MPLEMVFVASGDAERDQGRIHRLLREPGAIGRVLLVGGRAEAVAEVLSFGHPGLSCVALSGGSDVESVNRAMLLGENDVLVLGPTTSLSPVALARLKEALASGDRVGAAVASTFETDDSSAVDEAVAALPVAVPLVAPDAACVLLRRDVLRVVGGLDTRLATLDEALADWCLRALRTGFNAVRAPRAVAVIDARHSAQFPVSKRLDQRHPGWSWLRQRAIDDPGTRLAFHAIRHRRSAVSVCLDLRSLPEDAINGTGVYAVELARALLRYTPVKLSALAATEGQKARLAPLGVPVYLEAQTIPTVQIMHRPAQVFRGAHLPLLVKSTGALVITFQDLIAYRAPSTHGHPADFETYRVVSHLAVRAAQRLIAISEHNKQDLVRELGVSPDVVDVVHHGVDSEWFGESDESRNARELDAAGLAKPFFFFAGSDYAHKNLRMLLAAYAQVRSKWEGPGPSPDLVIVGHASGTPDGAFPALHALPMEGVRSLGDVSSELMRTLYQRAIALVYPSVFEGFGLPPLESMAAGTPVVCGRYSSVPEVVGDAALVVDPLTDTELAGAMRAIATKSDLRSRLVERGRARVKAFTWEKTAHATWAAYERALQAPSAASLHERAVASIVAERLFP